MEVDPTRMCELLVGLPAVNVLAVDDGGGGTVVVHIESRMSPPGCASCGTRAWVKDRPTVELVDLVLRAAGPPGLAQASVVLPRRRLRDAHLDR